MNLRQHPLHPVTVEVAMWLRSLSPKQRENLQFVTGYNQKVISAAAFGHAVPSAFGWGLAFWVGRAHLLDVRPRFC